MRKRRWLRLVLLAMALLLAASWGVSGALEYGWARRSLLARLSASFGRPVEAGRFSFSLFSGPRLEVSSITVAEDPRFGQEYFLRADQLTAGLRWTALLRGRIEFGTLSLERPSLNLVHSGDGHWNVESWLPPAAEAASAPGQAGSRTAQAAPVAIAKNLGRIEIDGGRINFKLGQEKLLFALVNVSGHLDQDGAGRWTLDLQANPMRASVTLQEAGTLWLRGTVAGTSARLRPAALNLTWEDASLADALRLASGRDYSVRGVLGAELTATIKDKPEEKNVDLPAAQNGESARGDWTIAGTLRLSGIHRWDLAARPADPAVNVSVSAAWSPGTPRLEVARCLVQSAHSQLVAGGDVDWSHGFNPSVRISSSTIAYEDLLAWRRSFRPNLPDDLAIDGAIGLQGTLAEWPLQIEQAGIAGTGMVVHLGALGAPIQIGPISAAMRRDSLVLAPVSVSLPGPAAAPARVRAPGTGEETPAPVGTLLVDGSLGPFHSSSPHPEITPRDWAYRLAVSGQTSRAQDLAVIAAAFGRPASADWTVEGTAELKLAWAGVLGRAESLPMGTLDLRGVQLTSVMLNQPLLLTSATIDLRLGERRVTLTDVQAFGTHWKGTLDRREAETIWQFDLSAARLHMADLDLWLGPRARPGFLQRMLPFASSGPPQARDTVFSRLAAGGRLRIAELSLDPLRVEKLDAAAELSAGSLTLRRAQADFFDGRVTGDLEARISADPAYSFHGQFERVNLAALAFATSTLEGRFAGVASGEISLDARGIGRDSLLGSLAGKGQLRVREPILRGFDLSSSSASGSDARSIGDPKPGVESRFSNAAASFHVSGGQIQVDQLSLAAGEEHFEIQGSVGAARQLDLHVWSLPRGADAALDINQGPNPAASLAGGRSGAGHEEWSIGGTLDAPQLTRQTHIAGNTSAAPGPPSASVPSRR